METLSTFYLAPIGLMKISGTTKGIISIAFVEKVEGIISYPECLMDCVNQLDEYFKRKRTTFSLPLLAEGSEFQKSVWNYLAKIPFGKTKSYSEVSKALGNKNSYRAVGSANAKNPIAVIIPCHRVIGNDGDMVGYNGGLWRKHWLLNFEAQIEQPDLF